MKYPETRNIEKLLPTPGLRNQEPEPREYWVLRRRKTANTRMLGPEGQGRKNTLTAPSSSPVCCEWPPLPKPEDKQAWTCRSQLPRRNARQTEAQCQTEKQKRTETHQGTESNWYIQSSHQSLIAHLAKDCFSIEPKFRTLFFPPLEDLNGKLFNHFL